ncbi:MAG: transcriptional repressor NrdR [bacterium]|nr:transcriptional repressor NrdR [bacterium]MCP5071217.1 transcriptional repressor NrdR [bacterium]
MRCPFCNEASNRVIDSRLSREGLEIRRRRECDECGRRFTTRERLESVLPKVIKHDERREEWDRSKLEHSVQKACTKRPVSENEVQRLVDRVERRISELGEAEVATDRVGDAVLDELSGLDVMAAARYASVFREFASAADYDAFFANLVDGREGE